MTIEEMKAAGARLKKARELLEMTVEETVEKSWEPGDTGVFHPSDYRHLRLIEDGQLERLDALELVGLCRSFGVSADWVLGIQPDASVEKLIATMKGEER